MLKKIKIFLENNQRVSKEDFVDIQKKASELEEVLAKKGLDKGSLYIVVFSEREKYSFLANSIKSILSFPYIFTQRAILSRPELAERMGQVVEMMKKINKIIQKEQKNKNKKGK